MGESDKGSRPANGSSGAAPRHRRPPATDVGEGGEMPSGDLARLLAAVGVLLGSHAAGDLVVVPREELERREYAAYGQGWRDAADLYYRSAGWADGLPAADAGARTPGQAAVIPFRRRAAHGTRDDAPSDTRDDTPSDGASDTPSDKRDETPSDAPSDTPNRAGPLPAAPPTGPARPVAGAEGPSASEAAGPGPAVPDTTPGDTVHSAPGTARTGPAVPGPTRPPRRGSGAENPAPGGSPPSDGPRPDPLARPGSATPSRPPAFAPKSRRSKVPTIPRLPRPRRRGRPEGQD
ncbi:hypothetical protein ABZ371_11335 [Streptomyces sp. NPDC005899]|uniref:hypothetical protein n=1 Tax=Streptomyces sp. NPDC005899 TaxID=3155716 RepID=UPI0033E76D31